MVKLKLDGKYVDVGFLSFVKLHVLAYFFIALSLFGIMLALTLLFEVVG